MRLNFHWNLHNLSLPFLHLIQWSQHYISLMTHSRIVLYSSLIIIYTKASWSIHHQISIGWSLFQIGRFILSIIVIILFLLTIIILPFFLISLIDIDIPFLIIIVRNGSFPSNALKSEELPSRLKADPSLKRIGQHIFLNKNQSPKLTLIILKHKPFPLKIINQIGMMPRY